MRVKGEKKSQIFPCIQYIWVKNSGEVAGSACTHDLYSAEQTIRINPQISKIPNKRECQGSKEIIYPVIG